MAISTGDRVKFYYIDGSTLPTLIEDSAIYALEGSHQLYVGSQLFGQGFSDVRYDSTANWDSQVTLVAERGVIYIYSDYQTSGSDVIPGFKVGDGTSYLIDMPFADTIYQNHISDTVSHITAAERTAWNNKVRCYQDAVDVENIIFTTNN